jgi:rSAM/selenodomain-associated transferase 1
MPQSPRLTPHASRLTADAALIIFAKAPIPGQVKTRLCPPLTPDEAASLHGSFVLDALERSRDALAAARLNVDRFLACSPSHDHVFFKILAERHGVRLLDQVGEDLGARMDQAFQTVFAQGYTRVVLTGSDLPSLPGSFFTRALSLLADHDLVLGPSLDGGYYLIGLTQPTPLLFSGIPWSTDQVLTLTRNKADSLGYKTTLLPAWRDVDTIEDVLALIDEVGLGHGASGERRAPRTASLSKRTEGALRLIAGRLAARQRSPKSA